MHCLFNFFFHFRFFFSQHVSDIVINVLWNYNKKNMYIHYTYMWKVNVLMFVSVWNKSFEAYHFHRIVVKWTGTRVHVIINKQHHQYQWNEDGEQGGKGYEQCRKMMGNGKLEQHVELHLYVFRNAFAEWKRRKNWQREWVTQITNNNW